MDKQPDMPPEETNPAPSCWDRRIFQIVILVLLLGSGLYVFKSCRDLPRDTVATTVDKTVQAITNVTRSLAELASSFRQGTISVSLTSIGTELEGTQHFQFEKVRQVEIFTHTDLAVTAFGYLPLPEVIVEARAPVEYIYYLDLEERWRLLIQDNQVHVLTPEIKYNKPSIDVSQLVYEVKKGSLFRDSDLALENLKRSITSLGYIKARENLELVRQIGREPVTKFVEQWLIRGFVDGSNYTVRVHFPREPLPPGVRWQVVDEEGQL